jgi:hypothetical protein
MPQDPWAVVSVQPINKGSSQNDPWAVVSTKVDTGGLTANDSGQGTYQMKDKTGSILHVPYGHVTAAAKAGFAMTDEDRARYVKDAAADPDLKNVATPEGTSAIGRNSAGEPILAPTDPYANSGPVGRLVSNAADAIKSAGKGVVSMLNPNPTAEEAARGETRSIDEFMRIPNRAIIDPIKAQTAQAYQDLKSGKVAEGLGHELAASVPFVGPWAAQVGEQVGQQAGKGDIAGAAGTLAGNAAVYAAPEVIGKGIKTAVEAAPKTIRSGAEAVTGTGARNIKALAEDTEKTNTETAGKHLDDTLDALDKTREAEDLRSNEQRIAQDKADAETKKANDKERERVNAANLKQIEDEGEARLKELEKNRENEKNYKEQYAKTKKENEDLYRNEKTRQKLESDQKVTSQRLIEKTKAAFKKATGVYNDKWNAWRKSVAGQTADMKPVVDEINEQDKTMNATQQAQFRQIISETKPDDDTSGIEKREQLSQQAFGRSYDNLTDTERAAMDKDVADRGITLADPKLKDIPAEKLHTFKHQLERAVRTEKDGIIRNAIGKVLDKLRDTEMQVSRQADIAKYGDKEVPKEGSAEAQLADARDYSRPYYDAFVKSPDEFYKSKAAGQMLKEQTPEELKRQAQQARLDRIAAYDPKIAVIARQLDNLSEALERPEFRKKLNVRKGLRELPVKPTPPSKMRTGVTSKPLQEFKPEETPKVEVAPAKRTAPPDRPIEKTISLKDLKDSRIAKIYDAAEYQRRHGIARFTNALYYTTLLAGFSIAEGRPGFAAVEMGSAPMILAGSHAIAGLMERPSFINWITKITPEDVAAWEKLPPSQKALFTENLKAATDAAEKKGITVSPLVKSFVIGAATNRKNTVKELRQEALRRNPKAIRVKAPDGSVHVFPDQQSANNFKQEIGVQ